MQKLASPSPNKMILFRLYIESCSFCRGLIQKKLQLAAPFRAEEYHQKIWASKLGEASIKQLDPMSFLDIRNLRIDQIHS